MKCPTCPDSTLVMSERQGVEIDYCPTCRGIWLDRGELDKLLERAAQTDGAQRAAPASAPMNAPPRPAYRPDFEDSDFHKRNQYGYSRKKSWLNEIFD
jgi:Zn-finger nucleic acid-binding protein